MKFLLATINIITEPWWRNIPTTQIVATPHHQFFVKAHVQFLWKIMISGSAHQSVLIRHMPIIPDEPFGIRRSGIGKSPVVKMTKIFRLWRKLIFDQDVGANFFHLKANSADAGFTSAAVLGSLALSETGFGNGITGKILAIGNDALFVNDNFVAIASDGAVEI